MAFGILARESPRKGRHRPPTFDFTSTANWDGYIAKWFIRDKQLFLSTITGRIQGKDVKDQEILSGGRFPRHATWFTGNIYLPIGDFNDEKKEHESVLVFKIEKGDVKAMTFFPSTKIKPTWDGL